MRVRYSVMILFLILSCEKETFDNPVDPDTELSPDDWAPTSLTIEILTDSDALLSWQKSEIEATGFKVERQDTTGGAFVEIGTIDTTIYTDTGLLTNNEYLYQVCAYSGDNQSSYATSSDTVVTSFPAPYEMSAVRQTDNKIELTWTDSTAYESGFVIERKNITSDAFTVLDSTQANTYQDTVITLGNQYVYKVGAYSQYNTSSYTDTALVKYWKDCLDVFGGDALEDACGICDNNPSNDCVQDCNDEWGGTATTDNCGDCVGGTTGLSDGDTDGDGICNELQGTVSDIDVNVYKTIQIGTQKWMAENLKVTQYKDGTAIPTGHSDSDWPNLTTGAYAVYDNNSSNADIYGNLYNWYVVENQQVCMDGWHVPSDDEYTVLTDYLGGADIVAGAKMKATGTIEGGDGLWYSNNEGATNESSFNGLPAGDRDTNFGYYYSMGYAGYFWSSSENNSSSAWYRRLYYVSSNVHRNFLNKRHGFSIRCIEGVVDCAGVVDGTAVVDCAGVCNGSATTDNCGTCDDDSSNDNTPSTGTCDCEGTPNGTVIEDCAGLCEGTAVEDCTGECNGSASDADADGICDWNDADSYATVQLGAQLWMAENLKVTNYRDGSEIPNIINNDDWSGLSTGAYGDYDNNPTNSETYGRLYNWYTVDDSRGVCPEGWHVPSDNEYTILTDYLGGDAGGKMKETGLDHWNSPNTGATNESGFTALPAGYRDNYSGLYTSMRLGGYFWSSSEYGSQGAWHRTLYYNYSNVTRVSHYRHYGFSIRCLGD